jgi:hypothetical protein
LDVGAEAAAGCRSDTVSGLTGAFFSIAPRMRMTNTTISLLGRIFPSAPFG